VKRKVGVISKPVNNELMNDWIFCHKHYEYDVRHEPIKESTTISTNSQLNSYCLITSFDQILWLLSQKSCSKFLFESEDKNLNLFLKRINLDLIYTNYKNSLSPQSDHQILKLTFRNSTNFLYKLFKIDSKEDEHKTQLEEILTYRLSFEVEWFRIERNLLVTLIRRLISSTKSLLPLETRSQTDSHLFLGYIDSLITDFS
jgi:hypothetical protein